MRDFEIDETGCLVRYTGQGGDVVIPDGVTGIGCQAFSDCRGLTGVTIPEGVTDIDNGAFSGCSRLKRVALPDSVTWLGRRVFHGCSSLGSIAIPAGVTGIGDCAFEHCRSLRRVTLPDSVTRIGERAFSWCSSLGSVTIPDSVTRIGDSAFRFCSSLESITIPAGVTGIGDRVFYSCSSLASVTLPDSVTGLGHSAFSVCVNLRRIALPAGVTRIGDFAFAYCSVLADITIPDGVTYIGERAFSWCTSLRSITIPDSVTCICSEAFSPCKSLRCIHISDFSLLPEALHGAASVGFAEQADADPQSVAGRACAAYIRKQLAKPGFIIFTLCNPALLSYMCQHRLITAACFDLYWQAAEQSGDPAVIALLLDYQYNGLDAKKLEAARKAKQRKEDRDEALVITKAMRRQEAAGPQGLVFAIAGELYTFRRPGEARKLIEKLGGRLASRVSPNVDYLVTNDPASDPEKYKRAAGLGIEVISEADFNQLLCRRFKDQPEIVIPAWVTEIGDRAFQGCRSLTSIIIPDSVTRIGREAFWGCSSLRSITIPASVTDIGEWAFYNCAGLTISTPAGSCAEAYAKQNGIPVTHI